MAMENAHKVLRDVFGHDKFRLSQEEVVKRLLVDGENALVLYPTGGGKSLCFQVPALCLEGLTLVISPLLSLMKDQVDTLVGRGVKAANLDSTLTMEKSRWVREEVISGKMKILYVAPERLNNESFIQMMSGVKISLLAVDESHCISTWGASFRPDYLKIARFAEEMDVERVLCLTATGTPDVARDICTSFVIDPHAGVFRIPVFRPNLALRVENADTLDEKVKRIVPFLKSRTGPAIIYVTLQKQAQEVADKLLPHGLQATVYHGGLGNDVREQVQMDFMKSGKGIVCATIAFGMGIDKANIRQVVHLHMPKTLEGYSQEIGRAGRDGLPSTCLMFLSAPDIPILEGFARGDTPSQKDLQLWTQEVSLKDPAKDGSLDFNHYQQSKTYDIRANTLGLCYAQLELDFHYIRAVTPFYSIYDIAARTTTGWQKVLADSSYASKAVQRSWRSKGANYTIDVVVAAESSGTDRKDLARVINDWELQGHITTKVSQVRARYVLQKPLPTATAEIDKLANAMFARIKESEEGAVRKLRQVIDFATGDDCIAQALAEYFGDADAVPGGLCGICTFCTTGEAVTFTPQAVTSANAAKIRAILNACPKRDDPRLLARFAFGITSPRLTIGKWSTANPLFGSMVEVDFDVLVEAFDKECQKAGYTKTELVASASPKKRSYGTYSSGGSETHGRGGSSGGIGRGGKRGKYTK
ncbi:ATP-dependent DNA helicase [Athelia psychrophila]|uniref:ATP-dependent DNA helicase n=1 Tax=Athelia psychrophila TaxID=1759441 RepID=A0A167UPD8_9AGAM|nr:ATP-dependent DNA helicase [Fibularhizoctonia sp. CBS 109695]